MLTLYYAPGACSLAAHIVLEEGGEKYEADVQGVIWQKVYENQEVKILKVEGVE